MPKKKKKEKKAETPVAYDAADVNSEQKAKGKKKSKSTSREELMAGWTPKKQPPMKEYYSENRLEQFDFAREMTKKNVWYYRDRVSVPRGPCTLPVLRQCWVNGVIDENTLIWGQGLADWLPAKNIRTLIPQIRSPEVQLATWLKKHLALKPAIARMRKADPEGRSIHCDQVDDMY